MHVADSQRLALRHVVAGDAAFLCRLMNEPSWLQNIGDRGVRNVEDAERYVRDKFTDAYASCGFGMYLTERRSDRTALGLCGLVQRAGLPGPDLGFAFLPECWGYGYAVEASAAVLRYARSQLGVSTVLAIVRPDNTRSVKVLERLGFRHQGEYPSPDGGDALALYGSTP